MNRRALALGAAMVLLVNLVAVALRAYAEAAFIAAYGKGALPWLLIASASGFAIATIVYDQITRRVQATGADLGLIGALLIAAALSPKLLDAGAPPVAIVIALAAAPQVVGLALWNRVAASVAGRDARRMLPRAGAAVTVGGVIAGLGVAPLIVRIGATFIPYVGAGVLAIVVVVYLAQGRALAAGGAPGATAPVGASPPPASPVRTLLRAMIVVAMLEGVLATVIDLQFLGNLKARYSGDSLAIALSLFYGGTNAVLLLLQIAAVPRILVTRSIPFTAAIHPVLVMLGYVVFAIAPTFVNLAGTRTTDQVLRLATTRTSQELELSAVPPLPRARWKVLLRGVLYPLGAGSAAILLYLLGPAVVEKPTALAGAAIGVAIVYWIAGQVAARRFQVALAAPLGITGTRRIDNRIDLETLERWTEAAGDPDLRTASLARAALARVRVDATDLADHLTHDNPAMRSALFDQLARTSPATAQSLKGELVAAIAIEDDDRALALGIKALALLGDDSGIAVAKNRAVVTAEVADALRVAELALRGVGDARAELGGLCARDPQWAIELARKAIVAPDVLAGVLAEAAKDPDRRAGALRVLAHVAEGPGLAPLADALADGDPAAIDAIALLDAAGATHLAAHIATMVPVARAIAARALSGAPAGIPLVAVLLRDADPEVAYAALRTALAIAGGGSALPAEPIGLALEAALAALTGYLDARDRATAWTACARHELDLAARRCVARLLWAAAVEAAAGGRDPAALTATARHLIGGRDADRRRALDVVQELQAGRAEILGVIERWLRPAVPTEGDAVAAIAPHDPWLAQVGAGELADLEPTLALLRKPALLATVAGPALADLARRARRELVKDVVFHEGDAGDTMLVVARGALRATRAAVAGAVATTRTIEVGGVVGELAVLTHAPRAATVVADPDAEVIAIDRATFASAARRAPELVLGLSATLAGWIAPNRPDLI